MSIEPKQFASELSKELNAIRKSARKNLFLAAEGMRRGIVEKFYTNANRASVGRRTGRAAKSWTVSKIKDDETGVVLSVNSQGVPYADFTRNKTIKPKSGKYVVIPVGPALTSTGAPRYPGNANGKGSIAQAANAMRMPSTKRVSGKVGPQSPFAWLKKDADTMLVLAKPGVTGPGITKQKRLLFVLKTSVKIPAYTRGLYPYVDDFGNKIFGELLRSK